ncbi:MAG: T9SS type A sorting domain-containing protein, partial [Myroides sp.]
ATTTDALTYTEQGTYTINWTYNDGNGNTTIQQQTIVVDDVTVPVPTVATLPTITRECAVTAADIPVPTANDNCVGIISATTTDALAHTEQGTYTINWTYNDGNGNTTTQQQTIVVDDVTAPVPAIASLPTITRECAVTPADIPVPMANDNCVGIVSATTTDALAYTEQGTYTINWTYNDGNGNTATQQQTIVVDDVTAPVPAIASLPIITRECAVTAADIPVPTANDNCAGTLTATTTDALTYSDQGSYTINWTYNDGNGNVTTQQQTIVVKDITKPLPAVAILPTITRECEVKATDIPVPTATDNCMGVITATTTDALIYTVQGTYTINWTYNDGNGNVTTQQQTIVVDDVTKPVPAVASLPTITRECGVTAADIPLQTANDNCAGTLTGTTTDALTYSEQGSYTINWMYNDGNGNTTTQQQTIVVDDVTAPVPTIASLPTITKECVVTATDIPVPTATDNCVGIITATTTDALIYAVQGTYTINWTYNDGHGNVTTQQQTIVVDDITKPVPVMASLPTITRECAVTATDIPVPTATDNCVGVITATTTDALTYTVQGTYTINWTYNDGNGNTTTQQQTIVVDDVTAPVPTIASLPTITKECVVTATDIPVPTATDNCVGIITATTTDALIYAVQGTYTINWTYNDGNGNTTTQQQTIVVDDVTKPVPVIASLPTITRECAVSATDIPVPNANDNCVGMISATTTDPLVYTEQGTYTINWSYNDGNGNTATQQQTIIVDDVTKPVPAVAILPTITRECAVTATDIPVPTATDNCVGVITATTTDALIYTVQGTYTINWTYNDGNGNVTTQQQTIVVDDITKPVPVMASLPTITRECLVTATDVPVPTAIDNCSGIITATTTDALVYTKQGTYIISWTYDDGNGNTTTQQQTIVVDDVTAPVPTIASLPTITRECLVTATDIPVPNANDNCVGMISATTTDPLIYAVQGTYTINWTYNDGNGNVTTQQQTIVVDDVTKPVPVVASLPTITRECAVIATDIPVPTAVDNCSGTLIATTTDALAYTQQGTYTVNWTFNDGNGNVTTQQQTIVVDDVTKPAPVVASLPAITRECAVIATDIPVPTAVDNCSGTLTATTTDALVYTQQGTYTINWTYNDGNGNTFVQQQTVIVEESPLADIVLNDLTTVYDGAIHKLMVDNLPAGAAVSYNITPQAEEANGAVNAGTYTVTAVVTPPASAVNCEAVTLTAELVIEKANQDILFNELEVVQLEDTENFQLSAVASSGLPVTYTYTYDQSTPAATVSPEGWVEIIHSGTVLITAQQQGNSNYLPAVSVERRLIIESKDASVQEIVINGVVYTDPDAVIYYMMDCNDTTNEVPVQIDAEYGATVSPARDFIIGIPKPGVYRNTVEVVSEDGTSVQRYQIIVERPFAFDDIVVQKFDNTLLINNNPQTNGGYRFVKYEWYRNDVLIGTEQVYSAGNSKQDVLDENALYSAILTTENGDVIHTCASEITRTNNFKINVYPNPVRVNEQLEVVFDYPASAFKGATAALYTTSGKLLQSVKLNENVSSVKLPAGISEGIYMLVLQIESRQETVKIVVKQ